MTIFVTGGAGFIGSALVRHLIQNTPYRVVVIDKLTYAGSMLPLAPVADSDRFHFEKVDICDAPAIAELFDRYAPSAVMHLAAESHVDRSIDGPAVFVETNVMGTYVMLEQARRYWADLAAEARQAFRFLHVSTDEVYGSLGKDGLFTESTPYDPSSPYSASKAASDHLARAWFRTFGLPTLLTNCSNNYGPYQFPEKLIPLMITKALRGEPLPVYGKGENVRDWLYVDDHARALCRVLGAGRPGQTYNIGGNSERRNIDVVHTICDLLDQRQPASSGRPRRDLIQFVTDRPGHDMRYAIDATKIRTELGWTPCETFESGLRSTVQWYLSHPEFEQQVRSAAYAGERLGVAVG